MGVAIWIVVHESDPSRPRQTDRPNRNVGSLRGAMWARLRSTGTRSQRGGGRCKTTCGAPGERRNHEFDGGEVEPKSHRS